MPGIQCWWRISCFHQILCDWALFCKCVYRWHNSICLQESDSNRVGNEVTGMVFDLQPRSVLATVSSEQYNLLFPASNRSFLIFLIIWFIFRISHYNCLSKASLIPVVPNLFSVVDPFDHLAEYRGPLLVKPVNTVTYKWSLRRKFVIRFARQNMTVSWTYHVTNWHFMTIRLSNEWNCV